jgi:hypothetical protein
MLLLWGSDLRLRAEVQVRLRAALRRLQQVPGVAAPVAPNKEERS